MQNGETSTRLSLEAFSNYIRTGRLVDSDPVEVKFNPWHDEETGRFTFAGQGRHFPGGDASEASDIPALRHRDPWSRPDSEWAPDRSHLHADHPRNYSIFTVERGDTLSDIARRRKGLTADDLASLNKHPIDRPLKIGQRVKVPHQAYIDSREAARKNVLALMYYMDTHGGKLPPNPAKSPSLESQILDTNWKRESKNGYDFYIDVIARPRRIFGSLSMGPMAARSRRSQAEAGKPDRRASDDGGHFIAARFNGPSDSFNHFAQDANFNRGAYRAMEDKWAKALQAGSKVFVVIKPLYEGVSKRPYKIRVEWLINGERKIQNFPNEKKGQADEGR